MAERYCEWELIRRLQGQRKGPPNKPIMSCLSFLDFSDQYLDMIDLYGADLQYSNFTNAKLNYANLMMANAESCIFIQCRVEGVYFSGTQLEGAKATLDVISRAIHLGKISRLRESNAGPSFQNRTHANKQLAFLQKRGIVIVDRSGNVLSKPEITRRFDALFLDRGANSPILESEDLDENSEE